ncbi:MAG: PDZ domain-containing protein, partial [Candidatus Micropelagos sp.]|nr:PDZ domain-containing protein [Candidatus Micropelagos sp.]
KVITDKKLPFVKFGDNTKARVGDWVIAIGNPFGLGGSLSVGVISAINRDINSGPYDSYIQTDAAINKGNSGGPLFNLDGEVIGVNTAIISPTGGSVGIGFSIPADMVQIVITQLREYGETRRGWLGVRIQRITEDLAESLGLSKPKGALVSEIIPGGPADEAGMKQGDVILTFDGKEVAEMRDLPRIVAETPIDKAVRVKVQRRGKAVNLKVKVGRLEESDQITEAKPTSPKTQTKQPGLKLLGLTLEMLDAKTRARAGLDDDKDGVLIGEVDADSSASESGVKSGDIIVEVDQTSVAKPQDVEDLVNKAKKAGKKSILVLMQTPQGLRFVAIKI